MTDLDDQALEALLVSVVRKFWSGPQKDSLTVNSVRMQAEETQGLAVGFFAEPKWKSRSKEIIKETVVCSVLFLPPQQLLSLLYSTLMVGHS